MSKTEPEADWPSTSSPTAPPSAVWYFCEVVNNKANPGMATNFRHVWQLGTFLRRVFDGAELDIQGHTVEYEIGSLRFQGRIVGATVADALSAARNVTLPRHEIPWVHWSRGMVRAAPEPLAIATETAPKPPREPAVPRVARSTSAITLAALCATAKVEPKLVRVELRKAQITRPEAGWEFEPGDERIAQVEKIIKGMTP